MSKEKALVQQALSRKATGMKLSLSERTVKFHDSTLLGRFDVAGQMGRMRAATNSVSAVKVPAGVDTPQFGAGEEHGLGRSLGFRTKEGCR